MEITVKLVVIFCISMRTGNTAKVQFYENSNFQGQSITIIFEGLACYNISNYFNDKASSLSTDNNCILAYEHADCEGREVRFAPGMQGHDHLEHLNFNDMISSFRLCSPNDYTCKQVFIDVDTSDAYDLQRFGQRVKDLLEEWYPFVCRLLYSPSYQEVDRIYLKFDPHHEGVAEADAFANRITTSANYYRNNENDIGSMIHEMAHVIQQYRSRCGWITEGIADSARRWYYESPRPRKPGPHDSYESQPVYFLNWIDRRWPNTLYWVNKECREGRYGVQIWRELTGRTPDELWRQMMNE